MIMSHTPPEPSNEPSNGNEENRPGDSTPPSNQPGPPQYGSASQPGQPYQPGQASGGSYGYVPPQQQSAPGYGGTPQGPRSSGDAGFFQALFDLTFKNFVTIRFAGVIYVVGMVALVVAWLIMTIASFTQSAGVGLLFFLLGAIVTFLYIVLFRVTLEFYVAMVRTAQNTSILVDQQKR